MSTSVVKNLKRRRTTATAPVIVVAPPPPATSPATSDDESSDSESSGGESSAKPRSAASEPIESTKAKLVHALSTIERLAVLSEMMASIDTSNQFAVEYFFGARIVVPLAPDDASPNATVRSYNHVVTNMKPHMVSRMTNESQTKTPRNFFNRITRKELTTRPSMLSDRDLDEASEAATKKANAEMALRVIKKTAEASRA